MTTEIFTSLEELSPVGFGVRTVFVGILLWFASRWLPRRSGGQYAGYDFTFFWIMGGLIASPLFDSKISFADTLTAAGTIYFWHYALSYLAVKNRSWAQILIGKPVTLIEGGKVVREKLRRALFPLEMLHSELRTFDAANPAEVEMAILETSGHVSILKKVSHLPVTAADLCGDTGHQWQGDCFPEKSRWRITPDQGVTSVLTDPEKTNNALKEALFIEEAMAKKYAHYSRLIAEPTFQQMLKGMEQASRGHHKMVSDQMSMHGIV